MILDMFGIVFRIP